MADNLFDDDDTPSASKPAADSKRNKLAELAARKRKEQEEAEAEAAAEQARKRAKKQAVAIDFGDSDEEEEGALPAEGEPLEQQQQRGAEDEGEGDLRVMQADLDFIDDTGLAPEERGDFLEEDLEQLAQLQQVQEAQEEGEDELDRVFNKAKRKQDGLSHPAEDKRRVESFLASMEVAVEMDFRDYDLGLPAMNKLRILPQLEDMVATKRLHNELLDGGLLGILKAFLEPMEDGTLPNIKVRETVLRLLHQLPVDCSKEDRKDQLKRSQLGRSVMFLYKLPDETDANRRLAKNLIERWSRPILAHGRREMDAREEERILEARRQRQAQLAAEASSQGQEVDDEGQAVVPKRGEKGFRWHAAVPQAASLDYVKQPEVQALMPDKKGRGSGKGGEHRLKKKLDNMGKASGKMSRAAQVSVEGRNVMVRQ